MPARKRTKRGEKKIKGKERGRGKGNRTAAEIRLGLGPSVALSRVSLRKVFSPLSKTAGIPEPPPAAIKHRWQLAECDMCVTLNPRIKIAPSRAPAGLVSYLLQNRAKKKNTPRAAFVGRKGAGENVRHKFPSISHKQELLLLLLPPPPPPLPSFPKKHHQIQISLFISLWELNQTRFSTPRQHHGKTTSPESC